MAFQRDPNELGTIWISEGRGKGAGTMFFGGRVFEIPPEGVTVDLLPFSYTDKTSGEEKHGVRVVRLLPPPEADQEITDSIKCDDEAPF